MRRFNYSFLKENSSTNLFNLASIIAGLNTREAYNKLQYKKEFEALRKNAIIASVSGSNAIEGIVTTEKRIRELCSTAEPVTHDEKEIYGYKKALEVIFNDSERLDVTEQTILMFHKIMEQDGNPQEAGKYKSRDNLIMEYDSTGNPRVRFVPVPSAEVKESMNQMLLAYYMARQDSDIPPLLLIPCVVLDFLCIHPFMDGNGRVSRLLTILLLLMNGYDICRYESVESKINEYRGAYYQALQDSSLGWSDNSNDYNPFIINFLQILYACYRDMDETFMGLSLKKAKKAERVEAMIQGSIAPLSKADILKKLPDVSANTVERVLAGMLKDGKIIKIGTYKNARYIRKF